MSRCRRRPLRCACRAAVRCAGHCAGQRALLTASRRRPLRPPDAHGRHPHQAAVPSAMCPPPIALCLSRHCLLRWPLRRLPRRYPPRPAATPLPTTSRRRSCYARRHPLRRPPRPAAARREGRGWGGAVGREEEGSHGGGGRSWAPCGRGERERVEGGDVSILFHLYTYLSNRVYMSFYWARSIN